MYNQLLLFVKDSKVGFGGMEEHYYAFRDYYSGEKSNYHFQYIVSCSDDYRIHHVEGDLVYQSSNLNLLCKELGNLISKGKPHNKEKLIMVFNDGHWIERLEALRSKFPSSIIMMRSGGNEFVKAQIGSPDQSLQQRQKKWSNIVNENVDLVISNSNYTTIRMLQCGFKEDKIHKIRGGIKVELCKQNINNRTSNRDKYTKWFGIKKILIVVAARFVAFKGIEFIIDAITMSKYKEDIFLLLVGDGPLKSELISKCQKQLMEQYYFTGEMGHAKSLELISIADILSNTSIELEKESYKDFYIHTETMGRSMLEAIGQGVPILATDVGGIKELFEENDYIGVLAKPNKDDIVNMLDTMIANQKKSEVCAEKYDWTEIFRQYDELWNEHI